MAESTCSSTSQTSSGGSEKTEPDSFVRGDPLGSPPGWTYNPSARRQRLPILILALLNCGIAGYLAVCQIVYHGHAWDPFFGDGTLRVLTSEVSRAFPVSDAALGAAAYLLEAIFCMWGDGHRWRSKPWLALSFGLVVLPLSVVSVVLMILQPVVVHAWCSLCLAQTAGMLLMVPLALDEVVASIQFLMHAYQRNPSLALLWHLFRHGEVGEDRQDASNAASAFPSSLRTLFAGFTPTWSLAACLALGLGCMITPAVLHVDRDVSAGMYVTGALVIGVSTLAMAEVARILRFVLMLGGFWLLVFGPWTVHDAPAVLNCIDILSGGALIALSYPRGRIRERYADWNRFVL